MSSEIQTFNLQIINLAITFLLAKNARLRAKLEARETYWWTLCAEHDMLDPEDVDADGTNSRASVRQLILEWENTSDHYADIHNDRVVFIGELEVIRKQIVDRDAVTRRMQALAVFHRRRLAARRPVPVPPPP